MIAVKMLKTFFLAAIETLKALSKRATGRICDSETGFGGAFELDSGEKPVEKLSSTNWLIRLVELLDCEP